MRRSLVWTIRAGLALGVLMGACRGDTEPSVTEGACQMVVDACHPKDDGRDETINGCHSRAHDFDDAVCSDDLHDCLAACDAAPHVGGTGEATDDGAGATTTDPGPGPGPGSGSTTEAADGSTSGGSTVGSTSGADSSTGADDSSQASCAELGAICHDTADDLGMMCHDVGHDGDERACAAIWVECIEHCS